MQKVMDIITQVAASRATVLITGESGTGKELMAKTIHATSPRADRAFVPVNTGSMPVDLLESTLFGHVKGAFTSAIATKRGLFEVANRRAVAAMENKFSHANCAVFFDAPGLAPPFNDGEQFRP